MPDGENISSTFQDSSQQDAIIIRANQRYFQDNLFSYREFVEYEYDIMMNGLYLTSEEAYNFYLQQHGFEYVGEFAQAEDYIRIIQDNYGNFYIENTDLSYVASIRPFPEAEDFLAREQTDNNEREQLRQEQIESARANAISFPIFEDTQYAILTDENGLARVEPDGSVYYRAQHPSQGDTEYLWNPRDENDSPRRVHYASTYERPFIDTKAPLSERLSYLNVSGQKLVVGTASLPGYAADLFNLVPVVNRAIPDGWGGQQMQDFIVGDEDSFMRWQWQKANAPDQVTGAFGAVVENADNIFFVKAGVSFVLKRALKSGITRESIAYTAGIGSTQLFRDVDTSDMNAEQYEEFLQPFRNNYEFFQFSMTRDPNFEEGARAHIEFTKEALALEMASQLFDSFSYINSEELRMLRDAYDYYNDLSLIENGEELSQLLNDSFQRKLYSDKQSYFVEAGTLMEYDRGSISSAPTPQ